MHQAENVRVHAVIPQPGAGAEGATNWAARHTSASSTPTRHDQISLARLIGERMREARMMACMGQVEAAKRLGYANSSKLSKIEGGKSSEVPLWVIKRAGWLYDVSLDYLMGNSATMERGDVDHAALREMHAFLMAASERHRARDVLALQRLHARIAEIEQLLEQALAEAKAADEARQKVEQQGEWQEVRGGSRWAVATARAAAALRTASTRLARYKAEARVAAGGDLQLDLVLD